jgi:hypothetical protein
MPDNKSLHWIFTTLRYVKTSELKRYIGENLLYGNRSTIRT